MALNKCLGRIILGLACLLPAALALDSNNRLVDYKDRITIVNTTDKSVVLEMDLYSFPYITNVSRLFHTYKSDNLIFVAFSHSFKAIKLRLESSAGLSRGRTTSMDAGAKITPPIG